LWTPGRSCPRRRGGIFWESSGRTVGDYWRRRYLIPLDTPPWPRHSKSHLPPVVAVAERGRRRCKRAGAGARCRTQLRVRALGPRGDRIADVRMCACVRKRNVDKDLGRRATCATPPPGAPNGIRLAALPKDPSGEWAEHRGVQCLNGKITCWKGSPDRTCHQEATLQFGSTRPQDAPVRISSPVALELSQRLHDPVPRDE